MSDASFDNPPAVGFDRIIHHIASKGRAIGPLNCTQHRTDLSKNAWVAQRLEHRSARLRTAEKVSQVHFACRAIDKGHMQAQV